MIDIPADATVRPLLIESRSAPAYCCLIDDMEIDDGLPWYHDIYHFLRLGVYPEAATTKDRRALRQLATRFVICGETLYRRSTDGMLLLCLDRASADRVMREVHAGVCGPHMGGHMLARKIMRTGYFWLTMETDCCQFVQRCPECQIHGDLIHVPPSELHALTSPWPFSVWGIDIIGKISPKSSSGHEFILVAIDYFTKWVEAASYARLTSSGVASFIRSHIICHYGVPHELISDRGVHFRAEVDTLVQRYSIRHHRSTAYRPQTNGAVEAANKNIKRILRKMVETSRDWSEKLPFALWAYRTSFRTSTGATPYSLVYGMEAVLPVEIEMGSLRVALEQQIPETDWAQARFDQLNLLDERRLRAADHVRAYQRKMARAFKKRVKPRPLHVGDLVLRVIRGLIRDPRGKFRPSWSGPYFIRELTLEGAAWLMDLDGNQFSEPTNVDQLKRVTAPSIPIQWRCASHLHLDLHLFLSSSLRYLVLIVYSSCSPHRAVSFRRILVLIFAKCRSPIGPRVALWLVVIETDGGIEERGGRLARGRGLFRSCCKVVERGSCVRCLGVLGRWRYFRDEGFAEREVSRLRGVSGSSGEQEGKEEIFLEERLRNLSSNLVRSLEISWVILIPVIFFSGIVVYCDLDENRRRTNFVFGDTKTRWCVWMSGNLYPKHRTGFSCGGLLAKALVFLGVYTEP
ncbi:hypothetical protein VitviT2T_026110 [Vitis vinifera]|uniref:Integrase catalytic domain-containing protein n=1 Tax=Vitis vinifera TaxID=29760 RepID=A0ABY9DMV2_VITVI|nr:hypothetical protein VitviT2T_026110 [Vitis vinifera]